ncbi:MAG: hypothetical protein NUW37_15565 [Planctomycetes bacterium]|nr:hypothetical protein [Planctomycetota bacterium]
MTNSVSSFFVTIALLAFGVAAGCESTDAARSLPASGDEGNSVSVSGSASEVVKSDSTSAAGCPRMGEGESMANCSMAGGSTEGCAMGEHESMEGCSMGEGESMMGGSMMGGGAMDMGCCAGEEEDGSEVTEEVQASAETQETEASPVIDLGNAKCPVLGGNVNKNVFTDFEGFRIYFCCPGCDRRLKANPETYMSKLLEDTGVSAENKAKIEEFLNK